MGVDTARVWRCLQVKMRCQEETSLNCGCECLCTSRLDAHSDPVRPARSRMVSCSSFQWIRVALISSPSLVHDLPLTSFYLLSCQESRGASSFTVDGQTVHALPKQAPRSISKTWHRTASLQECWYLLVLMSSIQPHHPERPPDQWETALRGM